MAPVTSDPAIFAVGECVEHRGVCYGLVAPLIEVDGVPSVIPHQNRTTTTFVQIGGRVFEIVNDRSLNLEKFQGVEEATLDLYTAVRNAYLQRRAKAIQE